MIYYEGGPDGGNGGPSGGPAGSGGSGGGGTGGVTPPPGPPKPPDRAGRNKGFLRRDPKIERRAGRNWEILSGVMNSLFLQGLIYEDPAGTWHISADNESGGLTGTFP